MKLIIDIPESRYRLLQRQASTNSGREKLDEFAEAVLNGTSIPDNATNGNELFDWVMANINAEKSFMGSCHDLADEEYHKGIIYAFECMKMKLM